jgi:hypothetical protein
MVMPSRLRPPQARHPPRESGIPEVKCKKSGLRVVVDSTRSPEGLSRRSSSGEIPGDDPYLQAFQQREGRDSNPRPPA